MTQHYECELRERIPGVKKRLNKPSRVIVYIHTWKHMQISHRDQRRISVNEKPKGNNTIRDVRIVFGRPSAIRPKSRQPSQHIPAYANSINSASSDNCRVHSPASSLLIFSALKLNLMYACTYRKRVIFYQYEAFIVITALKQWEKVLVCFFPETV